MKKRVQGFKGSRGRGGGRPVVAHVLFVMFFALVGYAGCATGDAYRAGRTLEARGESQAAYEQYCKAAAENPGSGEVATALARVRPSASAYWESQGLLAMDQGRDDDAWRMLMKALEIQPDAATTATMIRRLEDRRPEGVASARTDWVRRGPAALALLHGAGRGAVAAATLKPSPATESHELAMASAAPEAQSNVSRGLVDKSAPTSPPDAKGGEEAKVAQAESGFSSPTKPVISPAYTAQSVDKPHGPGADRVERSGDEPSRPPESKSKPSRPALLGVSGEFLSVQTLSLKDRSHPKSAEIVEGIEVRLKDTDADLEADLDLYVGKRRIKKLRNLKIGRSQVFAGSAGGLYRLTLLGVHHPSHTVRIGVKAE